MLFLIALATYCPCVFATSPALIVGRSENMKVNEHFTSVNNINSSLSSPNPDITILSSKYFLCVWSYSFNQLIDTNSNKTEYSNG